MALTGVSYKNFVKGSFSALIPIIFKVVQGTSIDSIEKLDSDDYETLKVYDFYNLFGTLIPILFGFGTFTYYTVMSYRDSKRALNEPNAHELDLSKSMVDPTAQAGGNASSCNSDGKEQANTNRNNNCIEMH